MRARRGGPRDGTLATADDNCKSLSRQPDNAIEYCLKPANHMQLKAEQGSRTREFLPEKGISASFRCSSFTRLIFPNPKRPIKKAQLVSDVQGHTLHAVHTEAAAIYLRSLEVDTIGLLLLLRSAYADYGLVSTAMSCLCLANA